MTNHNATIDVVQASVAVYTAHADDYANYNANAVDDLVRDFASQLPAGARVLDAGCGPGRDLARFTALGLDPVGVDLNPTFVDMARQHGTASVADLRQLPFDDDAFDAVWACASLVHLPPDDAAQALREITRVTRAGGLVYSSVKHFGATGWTDTPHGRRWFQMWTPEDYQQAVTAAGQRVTRAKVNPVFVDVWATT